MSSSLTVTTPSTSSRTIPNGTSPGRPTAIPSAMVDIVGRAIGRPAASEAGHAAAPSAWTPITWTSGRSARTAVATPASSPPPPVQTRIVRTSGHCCRISSPTVPCPATTSGWSNGWISVAPLLRDQSWAARRVSSTVCPANSTSAP